MARILYLGLFEGHNATIARHDDDGVASWVRKEMTSVARDYDVAVSFLSVDEPLALQIYAKLSESLDVFVYSLVPHTLPFMYALHKRGQHLCHRVQSVAVSGLFTVAQALLPLASAREAIGLGHRQESRC